MLAVAPGGWSEGPVLTWVRNRGRREGTGSPHLLYIVVGEVKGDGHIRVALLAQPFQDTHFIHEPPHGRLAAPAGTGRKRIERARSV